MQRKDNMSINKDIIRVNKIKKNFMFGNKRRAMKENVRKIDNYFGVMESTQGRVI